MDNDHKIDEFSSVTEAASELSHGTYSGTVTSANIKTDENVDKFSSVTEAASELSHGTYSGTVTSANIKE